jgi:hypothetical protein
MSVKKRPAPAIPSRLRRIGVIRSALKSRRHAPRQGTEGAPDAWLDLHPSVADGLLRLEPGDEIIVITWFHRAHRDVLQVHPRSDPRNPLTGVFATRSPDRPNPARSASGHGAGDRRPAPPTHRPDRGDRRDAGRRHQAGALRHNPRMPLPAGSLRLESLFAIS